MSFSHVVQTREPVAPSRRKGDIVAAVPFAMGVALALLIGLQWLAPGYVFGTDWPGPRFFPIPSEISSSAPLQIALAGLSHVVGSEITSKILILSALIGAGTSAFISVPAKGFVPKAAGTILFVANPFVFGRLHYGQLYLLAGYALLPVAAHRLRILIQGPSTAGGVWLGMVLAAIGVFTAHLLLVAGVMLMVVLLCFLVASRHPVESFSGLAFALVVAAATTLVLSAHWLVPLLIGKGADAAVIGATGSGALHAYAAEPDPQLGLVPNLLGLYGFWAEGTGRFTSMKAFAPGWPLVLIVILVICAFGAASAIRSRGTTLRVWVIGLLAAGVVGLILEIGVSHPLTAGLVNWLDSHFTLYRGMRDAGKWGAVLALVYSQLFGIGSDAVASRLRSMSLSPPRIEWLAGGAAGLLIALPLYYGNGLLFGMHGEIRPSQYPAGWYAADQTMLAGPHTGRALFLPWHEYMSYSFVRNQNNVIASLAPTFFSVPILSSADPEVPGIAPPNDPDQQSVSRLVASGSSADWASVLENLRIGFVLVAHEVDWRSYSFLESMAGIQLIGAFGSIDLYRVQTVMATARGPDLRLSEGQQL
jgi:hypothetical protein